MNNISILTILGACVGVALGVWYVTHGIVEAPTHESDSTTQQTRDTTSNESQNFSGSMQELLARGGSWKCDVESMAGGVVSRGTTYAANGMVRADFISNIPQVGDVETHMIMRDKTAYTWTSMMNRGFKFPISESEGQTEMSSEVAAPVSQNYDFSCIAWPADENTFTVPSEITF